MYWKYSSRETRLDIATLVAARMEINFMSEINQAEISSTRKNLHCTIFLSPFLFLFHLNPRAVSISCFILSRHETLHEVIIHLYQRRRAKCNFDVALRLFVWSFYRATRECFYCQLALCLLNYSRVVRSKCWQLLNNNEASELVRLALRCQTYTTSEWACELNWKRNESGARVRVIDVE